MKRGTMAMNDPREYLRRLGQSGDGPHDIARAALMLSALDHPRTPLEPYERHLGEIESLAREEARGTADLAHMVRALAELIAGRLGYDGDRVSYDDPKNADLMSVIDRRRGMPVALGILYLHAARAAGLNATGLNTPGHFLLALGLKSEEVFVDPFNGGTLLERERRQLPQTGISTLPDEPSTPEPVCDTDVLLRLENNLKIRALETKDGARALEIAKRMVLFAPSRAELWFDLARLNEASEALGAARDAYQSCLALAAPGQPLHNEAALALLTLKRRLN